MSPAGYSCSLQKGISRPCQPASEAGTAALPLQGSPHPPAAAWPPAAAHPTAHPAPSAVPAPAATPPGWRPAGRQQHRCLPAGPAGGAAQHGWASSQGGSQGASNLCIPTLAPPAVMVARLSCHHRLQPLIPHPHPHPQPALLLLHGRGCRGAWARTRVAPSRSSSAACWPLTSTSSEPTCRSTRTAHIARCAE